MKNKFCTIILLAIGINALGQITVTDSDLVNIGDVIYQAYDANPAGSINVGNPGVGQNWDFSLLQVSNIDTLLFISPVGTPNANLYNNVNICMDDKGSITYFNKNSTGLYIHGISDTVFNSPALFLPLPLNYGLTISDGPIVVIEQTITGPFLNTAISPATVYVLTNGLANSADTARIQVTNTTDFEVDGSGSITTPLGVYDVLRLKMTQNTSSVLNVYCSDTVSGIGTWINNIPFSSIPILAGFSNDEQEIKYQWITNDASVKFLLAEIIVDSLDNIINGVSFQSTPLYSSATELPPNTFDVYPVPASYQLIIESKISNLTDLTFLDFMGKLVFSDKFKGTTKIDLTQISKGIYFINLKTSEVEVTKKIIVE